MSAWALASKGPVPHAGYSVCPIFMSKQSVSLILIFNITQRAYKVIDRMGFGGSNYPRNKFNSTIPHNWWQRKATGLVSNDLLETSVV